MKPIESARIGDRVSYVMPSLIGYKGTITAIGQENYGGNCRVRWDRTGVDSVEVLNNLRRDDNG